MSNSPLATYVKISPHKTSPRKDKIKKITIHHMAGNLTVEQCGAVFGGTRKASTNYGVGSDGRIGLYVDERDRAWATANAGNDNQAINIEVANCSGAPEWRVSDTALESLVELCVDICKRNGIERLNFTGDKSGNLTMHKYFMATACPGPYLESKFGWIADKVNKRLAAATSDAAPNVAFTPYIVRISASVLNVRAEPSAASKITMSIKRGGAYTIVEERDEWGKLKSGAGWINLAYTTRI